MTRLRVTEADFQRSVIDFAQRLGWRVGHFCTSPTRSGGWSTAVQADGKGFPDLVMVRRGRLIFAELKSSRGQLGAEQAGWLMAFQTVAHNADVVEVHVWKPGDWHLIEQVLE